MAIVPEGWYADPTTPDQERWWDGEKWSLEQTRPKGSVAQPNEPPPVLEVRPSIPVGWYPIAGDPGTERYFDGSVWTMQVRPAPAVDADDVVVPGVEEAAGDEPAVQPQTPPEPEGSAVSDSVPSPEPDQSPRVTPIPAVPEPSPSATPAPVVPEPSPSPSASPTSTGVVSEPSMRPSYAKPVGVAVVLVLVAGARRRLRRRRRR